MSSNSVKALKQMERNAVDIAQEIEDRIKSGCMISYAQNYEDVMLRRVFPEPEIGFFVDVGAFHPTFKSVTRHFKDRGWFGINIEPDRENIDLFGDSDGFVSNIHAAVGSKDEEQIIYLISGSSRSTFSSELAEDYRGRGFHVQEKTVSTRCLASILDEYNAKEISFLKIDVEGAEAEVIKGADWSRHRPRVVLAEATYPETTLPAWQEWEPMLLDAGYLFAYFDGLNRFYVREENADLLKAFDAPPNYFDNFVRFDSVVMADQILGQ